MQKPSFDELAREWGTQTKEFLTLLGDQVTQRLKAKLPMIIGGGIYGAFAVVLAAFVLSWLSVAGYQELLTHDFTPMIAALITAGSSLVLCLVTLLLLKFHISHAKTESPQADAELSEAGKELITLSKDVARSTLTPKALLKDQAGKILAGSLVLGFFVGMAAERPAPESKR